MKKEINIFLLILTSLLLSLSGYSQENSSLKVVRGKIDTARAKNHYIVGVATPGSEVSINDLVVKQYATGSFGTQLILKQGDNPVSIRVVSAQGEESEHFSIFYEEPLQRVERERLSFDRPVVVTKEGAYLNSSAGRDRLGGAKINFLPEGVKMELLGVENNLYKVKLSQNRWAYIPKQFAQILPFGESPAFSISGSWNVSSADGYDRVIISLENRQPFVVHRYAEPNKIVVELHGVVNNSNWVTQYSNLKAIDYVDLKQIDSDVLEVTVALKEKFSWGYVVDYVNNSLEIKVKQTPVALYARSRTPFVGLTIGLDAGHGGSAPGAISPSGITEKEVNLDMVFTLKEMIEKRGGKVILSRSEDIDLSMQERLTTFREGKVDLMLSIHCNAGGNPLIPMGTSTYYRHIEHKPLAQSILKSLMELNVAEFGLVGNFNFSLNSPTDFPAILVEVLFMSSLPDEELLASSRFRKEMMEKVVMGLEKYINEVRESLR